MKTATKRRWIYLISILLAVCCILMWLSPKTGIARLALTIAQPDKDGTISELVMSVPVECRLETIYLRGNGNVPREGKLFDLFINGTKYSVSDFGQLSAAHGEIIEGYENKAIKLPIKELRKHKDLVVTYGNLDSRLKRDDLVLVIEVAGEDEKVKKWNEFIKLRPKYNTPVTNPA